VRELFVLPRSIRPEPAAPAFGTATVSFLQLFGNGARSRVVRACAAAPATDPHRPGRSPRL